MFYFKTVSFTLTMGDVPMTFGASTTKAFHNDWYDGVHSYPMDADLFEFQGEGGDYECPGIVSYSVDLVKVTNELYGSNGDFNPFEKIDDREGPTRNTVRNLVTHVREEPAFFKQFIDMKEVTPRLRRILCEVAGYAATYLEPVEAPSASHGGASGASSSSGIRFSQNSKVVRLGQWDNRLIQLSELSAVQVKELNNAGVYSLNMKARHSYSVTGATTLQHPTSMSGFKDMASGMLSVVSKKLGSANVSEEDRARYTQLLGLVNSSVTDTEAMLRRFMSTVCAKVFSTNAKSGASLLSKGQLPHFLRALHAWAHGQMEESGLGNLRIGPSTLKFDISPVNLIHLISLFHFMFAELSSSAVQKAKDLLTFYDEVVDSKKRPLPTPRNSPNKAPRPAPKSSPKTKTCYNCGEKGHVNAQCPKPRTNEHMTCFKCGKKGHHRRDCPEKTTSA